MKKTTVVVPWREGLHLRQAVALVKISKFFRANILLRSGQKLADLRSIVSIISLCATMGTTLDVEASGEDEADAMRAMERVFCMQSHIAPADETSQSSNR